MTASTHLFEEKTYSPQELFNLIYFGAKELHKEKIDLALQHASLSIIIPPHLTPIYYLAYENTPAAEAGLAFLLEKFPEKRTPILIEMARGYTKSGQLPKAKNILAQAKHPIERSMLLSNMIRNAAEINDDKLIKELLDQAIDPEEKRNLQNQLIEGHAKRGDQDKVNSILSNTTDPHTKNWLTIHAVTNYAFYCHTVAANNLISHTSKTTPRMKQALQNTMIGSLIFGGHTVKAEHLLHKAAKPKIKFLRKRSAIANYAAIGDTNRIKDILDSEQNRRKKFELSKSTVTGFSQGGYITHLIKKLQELIPLCDAETITLLLDGAIVGLAKNMVSFPDIKKIFALAGIPEMEFKHEQLLMRSYVASGHISLAIEMLHEPHSADERRGLFEKIEEALNLFNLNLQSLLFTLAVFPPSDQGQWFGRSKLLEKTKLLHPYLTEQSDLTTPINYRFRLGEDWPQTQIYLLIGIQLVQNKKLDITCFLHIATFLGRLSYSETRDLSNRLHYRLRNGFFKPNEPVIAPPGFYEDLAQDKELLGLKKPDRTKRARIN